MNHHALPITTLSPEDRWDRAAAMLATTITSSLEELREVTGIIAGTRGEQHPLTRAMRRVKASAEEFTDVDSDWAERLGASRSRPVSDMHGNGPLCSWCGAIWPLCGHHHTSEVPVPEEAP